MEINIRDKKELLEWAFSLGSVILGRVNSYQQDRAKALFISTRELINEGRRTLSTLALDRYENLGLINGIADFPLITRKEWILNKPSEFDIVELLWDREEYACPSHSHSSFPISGTYAMNTREYFPGVLLEDNFSYRLRRVYWRDNKLAFFFCPSSYFDFYNSCEVLSYEFAFSIMKGQADTIRSSSWDISEEKFPIRDQTSVFELSNRGAIPGISTLLVILNPHRDGINYFYLHNRNSPQLAEAANTHHVVPAGTFQPDGYYDNYHDRDFSLIRNIMREFAEELLGKAELKKMINDEKDFMKEVPIKHLAGLVREGYAKHYLLGMGLDPLNTKPEILRVC